MAVKAAPRDAQRLPGCPGACEISPQSNHPIRHRPQKFFISLLSTCIKDVPGIFESEQSSFLFSPQQTVFLDLHQLPSRPASLRNPPTFCVILSRPWLGFRSPTDILVFRSRSIRQSRLLLSALTMFFDTTRRRVLDGLNRRYIYGRVVRGWTDTLIVFDDTPSLSLRPGKISTALSKMNR